MGDVGYLDEQGRFWYCGRKSQRVETKNGPLFAECVEAVFNRHPDVRRSALVGLGDTGNQAAVICVVPAAKLRSRVINNAYAELEQLCDDPELAKRIDALVYLPHFPVDIRHNSKILREMLRACVSGMVLRDPAPYSDFVYSCAQSPTNRLRRRPPFATWRNP
jgi:acyl-coenzyme A synthetase/AMP-(fatty) acid ligase